jgi:hypothetical protein
MRHLIGALALVALAFGAPALAQDCKGPGGTIGDPTVHELQREAKAASRRAASAANAADRETWEYMAENLREQAQAMQIYNQAMAGVRHWACQTSPDSPRG